MNDRMWAHRADAGNVGAPARARLPVLDPRCGALAAGEGSGTGRMPEPETIFAHVGTLLEPRRVARRAQRRRHRGADARAVDPVRFISNHSSGKMGVAIAAAAWRRGADVTLDRRSARSAVRRRARRCVPWRSTEEMRARSMRRLARADVLVMAAAPADFRAGAIARRKDQEDGAAVARSSSCRTPDILRDECAARARRRGRRRLRARDERRGRRTRGRSSSRRRST